MSAAMDLKRFDLLLVITMVMLITGCDIASSYRPAHKMTIRDFSGTSDYRKKIGVLAVSNTTLFTSDQVALPFMTAFLNSMKDVDTDALIVAPGKIDAPPFLWNPPRIANGDMDVFGLSDLARQEGMNVVVSPVLMDIRVRVRDTGFWWFKDVAYSLQIQTATAVYDVVTGTRLALGILTDEVEIDEDEADIIRSGQEIQMDELVEMAEEMGEDLGEQMGRAVNAGQWHTAVVSIVDGACVITAGSEVGIASGDRFAVLDGSGILTGLDDQRYIIPGEKIGDITINRVTDRQSYGTPESGDLPPAGSIVVPER